MTTRKSLSPGSIAVDFELYLSYSARCILGVLMVVVRKRLLIFYFVVIGLLFISSAVVQNIQKWNESTLLAKTQEEESKTLVK